MHPTQINVEKIKRLLTKVVSQLSGDALTHRNVRASLARAASQPADAFEGPEWKDLIREETQRILQGEPEAVSAKTDHASDSRPDPPSSPDAQPRPRKRARKSQVVPSDQEEEEGAQETLAGPSVAKQKGDPVAAKKKPKSSVKIERPKVRLPSAAGASDGSALNSSGLTQSRPSLPTSSKPSSHPSKSVVPPPLTDSKVSTSGANEKRVGDLQKIVVACGVRKVWTREFRDFPDDYARQASHCLSLLKALGMKGDPTLAKAARLREEREAVAELADLQRVDQERGRNSRPARSLIDKTKPPVRSGKGWAEVEASSDEEEEAGQDQDAVKARTARQSASQAIFAFLDSD